MKPIHSSNPWSLESFDSREPATWTRFDYGKVLLFAGRGSGREIVEWFVRGRGSAYDRPFELRVTQLVMTMSRQPRYGSGDGITVNRPFVQLSLSSIANRQTAPIGVALVREGRPSYNDFDSGVYKLIYEIERPVVGAR